MMRRIRKAVLSNIAHVAPYECRWAGVIDLPQVVRDH
jgi:hypothetical protein